MTPIEDALVRSVRLMLGGVGLGLAFVSSLVRATQSDRDVDADEGDTASTFALAASAAIGVGVEVQRRAIGMLVGTGRTLARTSALAVGTVLAPSWRTPVRRRLQVWGGRGSEELAAAEDLATEVVSATLRQVVDAVLREVDLDALVARVDLDALVQRIDVESVVRRIDLDALVDRVDVDRILQRVDLDEVLERVDPDRIVDKVDVEAIVRRLDLAGMAREVMDELQVDEIIRESTGSLAVETVDAVRVRGMSADTFVAHMMDRLVRRKNGRELQVDGSGQGDEDGSGSDG